MERPQNRPDLRSPKSKFRDIRFVGTDALINSWKVHVDFLKTIVTVKSLIFFEVGSLDLTWDDLGLQFSGRVRNWCMRSYAKTSWCGQNAPTPQPPGRRLRLWLGQLPPQLDVHVVLAQILHYSLYQSWEIKKRQRWEFSESPVRKKTQQLSIYTGAAPRRKTRNGSQNVDWKSCSSCVCVDAGE